MSVPKSLQPGIISSRSPTRKPSMAAVRALPLEPFGWSSYSKHAWMRAEDALVRVTVFWVKALAAAYFSVVMGSCGFVLSWSDSKSRSHQTHGHRLWFHRRMPVKSEKASRSAPMWPMYPLPLIRCPARLAQMPDRISWSGPLSGWIPRRSAANDHTMTRHISCMEHLPPHPHLHASVSMRIVIILLPDNCFALCTGVHRKPYTFFAACMNLFLMLKSCFMCFLMLKSCS